MNNAIVPNGKVLLYQYETESVYVDVYFKNDTFWMTQRAMAELFEVNTPAISKHLQNIFDDEELERNSTVSKMETVRQEGTRQIRRELDFYNLDAIIAVGYRVNSKKATRFRQWATKTLREYVQKGFVLNDDMLKNGQPFGRDYFDELLTWKAAPSGKILKSDVIVAKNYLNERELSRLNRLVTMFIDHAELMAEDEIPMSMQDWLDVTDQFLKSNRRKVLDGKGQISYDEAVCKVTGIYAEFRKRQDLQYVSEFDRQMERYLTGDNGEK